MSDLLVAHFDDYFAAVHGFLPFPWQRRLLQRVIEDGWPAILDLPTGSGKTAAIDIALFHLALEATSQQRRAPVRIVLVVNRRTVVDQAYDRAKRIAEALDKPRVPILQLIRERLVSLSGGKSLGHEPLEVAVLRGGIARDDDWARSPVQPLVVLSTVDQVGSRLLFRGYGVSRSMRPVHAGLLGNDTLFLLDEVHLAEPFRQTLHAIRQPYRNWSERRLPDRWQVVSMSATTTLGDPDRFGLDKTDRSHPVLRRRLEARKPARLVEVKVSGSDAMRTEKLAERLAEMAAPPPDLPSAAVAVIVNRVRTAQLVFERVRSLYEQDAKVYLLTGRMRPLDREDVEREVRARAGAGRRPRTSEDGKPTIVVATQSIEAGADLDFDVLITECASFDALKQRFGRLNRLGDVERCAGAIVMRSDQIGREDAVYGPTLSATWSFLARIAEARGTEVDFGVDALTAEPDELFTLVGQPPNAPVLLPAHLDTWVQTTPVPEPDPDVSLWLHGPQSGEPEVQIVWRADISEAAIVQTAQSRESLELLLDRIEICPPLLGEALAVPLSAARRWLADAGDDRTSDVEGAPRIEEEDELPQRRRAVAWRGEESVIVSEDRAIRPGDTLVVPASYGGLIAHNWAPESREPVADIGDRAAAAYRSGRRTVLRLHPDVWRSNLGIAPPTPAPSGLEPPAPPQTDDDGAEQDGDRLDGWLKDAAELLPDGWVSQVVRGFVNPRHRRVVVLAGGRTPLAPSAGVAAEAAPASYYAIIAQRRSDATTEDEVSSFTGVEVTLNDHLAGVGSFARDFAERCGLPPEVVAALELAGRWHDIGKADPRFQLILHGGNPFRAGIAPAPLAKSAVPSGDRAARLYARKRSGYPDGYRHELMSAALLLRNLPSLNVSAPLDLDLVLHLVSSHHGWCRPFAPVAVDMSPVDVEFTDDTVRLRARSDHGLERLDSGVSDRFFRLVRRYGWFGLAWLEAILRLADHRRSEWEQESR